MNRHILVATRRRIAARRTLSVCLCSAIVGAVLTWLAPGATAQDFPFKPLRMIVPASAASPPDIIARLLADKLGAALGQRVVVENRVGGSGIIAMNALREMAPDGHSIGFVQSSVATVTPLTFKAANYDVLRDFEPVAMVAYTPMLLVANNQAKAQTLDELLADARARPDIVVIGNPFRTSVPHLTAEYLAQQSGVRFQHVSFGTQSQALQALLNGDVSYYIDGVASLLPQVRAGKLKAIGVSSERELPRLEGIPVMAKRLGDSAIYGWFVVVAPKGISPATAQRLNEHISASVQTSDIAVRFGELGTYPMVRTVAETRSFVQREAQLFAKIVQTAGIKPE